MDYVVSIFFLGLMVTLLVAKGILMAKDYTVAESEVNEATRTPENSVEYANRQSTRGA
jgi:hypothetical protein